MSFFPNSPLRVPPFPLRSCLFGLLATAAATANAQDLTIKAGQQKQPVVIRHATVHTVRADKPDETIADGVICFSGGTLQVVGTAADFEKFAATVRWAAPLIEIDGTGLHLYPGLVGSNTRLGLTEFSPIRQTNDLSELGDITPEVCPATAINPDSTLIPVTRTNGVLTVATRPSGALIPGQTSVIALDGWTTDEMALIRNAGMSVNWPQMRSFEGFGGFRRQQQAPEEQERQNRQRLEGIERVFDSAKAYADARAGDAATPIDLRWEAMRGLFAPVSANDSTSVSPDKAPAKGSGGVPGPTSTPTEPHETIDSHDAGAKAAARQLPLWITANDLDQIQSAVAFCQKRHLRMILIGGQDAPMCAQLLKDNKVPVLVTSTFSLPRRSDADYDAAYTLPLRLFNAGVTFAIATSDDTAHERNLPYHAAIAAAHGLPVAEALKAVTISPAQILGVGDRVGSLEQGKLATFLLTTGNPLEVDTQIKHAYIAGREIDLSNKQSKLYEKYRERYKQMGLVK